MSMVINLVEDHNIYLCEGGPVYNGSVQPSPITYLTQWKIVGNSQVHTDPYLTSWKVSGNSQVHTLPYPDGVVLPNGYKRCEYLKFDGNSYINTGVKTANDIGFNLACSVNNQSRCLIGSRLSQNANGFILGFASVAYGGASIGKSITYNQTKTTVILDSTQCKVGGTDYNISDIKATSDLFFDIYVGTWNNNETPDSRMWEGNIYDTIIYNIQGELWHGIPCLDANDVPCFYDIVSQTAFYNQGSGSFTYELYPQPTEIWSCGDLGQDGMYHVKISNGVNVYDIALDEPLRKVNDVVDTIEFPSDVEGKALVTRRILSQDMGSLSWSISETTKSGVYRIMTSVNNLYKAVDNTIVANILCTIYNTVPAAQTYNRSKGCAVSTSQRIFVYDPDYNQSDSVTAFISHVNGINIILELATPITELVDVSPFPISATDTYTSANVVPYSAFEHTENKEIWSCGEYSAVDGKYHILVQPQGGSIADIALTEPLRKVNNVADIIEFPSSVEGKALITRNTGAILVKDLQWQPMMITTNLYRMLSSSVPNIKFPINNDTAANVICPKYNNVSVNQLISQGKNLSFSVSSNGYMSVLELPYSNSNNSSNYIRDNNLLEFIYELATPTTELVDAPQIEEAESYTCVISQGGKAVSWSSFETNSE